MKKSCRIVAVILSVMCLLMLFAGCGRDYEKADEKQSENTKDEKQETAQKDDNTEVVEIEVVTWNKHLESEYEILVEEFRKDNPNIIPRFVYKTGGEGVMAYLTTVFQSGQEGADMFITHGTKTQYLGEFVEAGLCEQLDGKIDTTGFPKLMVQRATIDGKLYATPGAFGDTFPVFYNKDIFKEQGISEPKTYDELLQICDKLKIEGVQPFTISALWSWGTAFDFWNFINFTSPEWCRAFNRYDAKFSDPEFIKGAKEFVNFVNKGYYGENYKGLDANGAMLEFTSGKAAMICDISRSNLSYKKLDDFNFGAFYWPSADGKSMMIAGQDTSTGFSMYSKSMHKDETLKFMKYLMSIEANQYLADLGSNVPYLDELKVDDPVLTKLKTGDVIIPLWSDQITSIQKEGINGYDVLNSNIQKLLLGETTVEEMVEELDKAMDYSKEGETALTWN